MTPKEKKWTQLISWVNSNTCFSGRDMLDIIRAIDDSSECECSDYDKTKTCLTCVHRVTVGHESYCDDPDSGWHYHGKVLRCERWQAKDKKPLYECSTCSFYRKADRWCSNYNSELRGNDGCSEWKPTSKEPTDASYLLMTLLTKQITKLQDQVEFQRDKIRHLEKRLDDHTIDKDVHLRQPEKYCDCSLNL